MTYTESADVYFRNGILNRKTRENNSLQTIHANQAISITDLIRDSSVLDDIDDPIAILKNDVVKWYLIPPKLMAEYQEAINK